MKSGVSGRNIYIDSADEEDDAVDEEESSVQAAKDDEEEDSGGSDESSVGSPRRSRLSSYNTAWPQSYRQSIDIYSNVASPSIAFLGTPSLIRLGSSFFNSSFRGRHASDVFSSLIKPLLPSRSEDERKPSPDIQHQRRKSSHSLLPPPIPTRRPSVKKERDRDHDHDKVSVPPGQSSYGQAVINGVNVLCGVGILSAPYAVKEGGWMGMSILFTYAVLAFYTGMLLRHCLDSRPGLETYPDIGQAAFGTPGRIILSITLYLELYACCVEHIILESDNLSSLFPNAHLDISGLHLNSHLVFALLTTLIVLPTTWLRDLSVLSYISAGGVIATLLVAVCLFWLGLVDQVGFKNEGSSLNLSGISLAVGLYGYSYSGHAVFPNIYSSLKKPNDFPAVLFTSFFICTLLYAGVAVMGFFLFGESTQPQFTLSMPHGFVVSKIAVWTTVVNPLTKYALSLTPMALSLEELIPQDNLKSHLYSISIRTVLTLSTLIVALTIPFFGLVMALIGSLLTMLVSFVFPCICFLSIVRGKATQTQVVMCILIVAVGLVSSGFGTFSAVSKIVNSLL
ncbi:vacuolar amino acid transporter 1-like [Phalaenopsis equestris]|uniref:vacuolar amino acid transporter 1-like n=1 Tax=Phalaenopsis equestris TaxID=78828 RepID=UPI0009E1D0E3|nr:vacuolar amino acid transporter 1-like [Phalaenopsis equestris]